MSNVLAAIGRGQLRVLEERVLRKREIFEYYHQTLGDLPGIDFMPEAPWGRHNRWLTVITLSPPPLVTLSLPPSLRHGHERARSNAGGGSHPECGEIWAQGG